MEMPETELTPTKRPVWNAGRTDRAGMTAQCVYRPMIWNRWSFSD
jgi:hypothetical protein